jgi:hypothetical protein
MSVETDLFLTGSDVTLENLSQINVSIPKGNTLTMTGPMSKVTNAIIYGTLIIADDCIATFANVTCSGGTIQSYGQIKISSDCILTDTSSVVLFGNAQGTLTTKNMIVDKQTIITVQPGAFLVNTSSLKLSADSEIISNGTIKCEYIEPEDPFMTFLWYSTTILGYFVWRNRKTIFRPLKI